MAQCQLCKKTDPNLSLLLAHHKDMGKIYICRTCWTSLYSENRIVTGGTGSCGAGGSCSCCR